MDARTFAAEIEPHRSYLMRIATLQLRDRDAAEDVVQDTLVAALAGQSGFTGRSSLKTWLTGILKHKIVDAIRRRQREPLLEASLPEETDLDDFEPLFNERGAWDASLDIYTALDGGYRKVATLVTERHGLLYEEQGLSTGSWQIGTLSQTSAGFYDILVKKRNGNVESPSDGTAGNQVYRFDGERYSPAS